MKTFKPIFLTLIFLIVSIGIIHAQTLGVDPVTDVLATPQFFASLVAGVLLAIGFQVLLTALSVAVGISAVGDVEKQVYSNKKKSNDDQEDHSDDTPIGVKISTGVGLWTMITASIALFCASLLAVELSLVGNVVIGVTLGLVIWATFFTVMAYLEIKSVSSLLGSLISTAISGIRSSASAVQHLFQGSPYGKIEDIAEKTIHRVREEMEDAIHVKDIQKKIDEYMDRAEESGPDYEQIKKDFIDILKDVRFEEKTKTGEDGVTTELFVKLASEQPNFSKRDIKKLANVFDQAKQAVQSGANTEDKAKKLAAQFTSASEEDIDEYVRKIEDYLRNTGKEELNPERIRNDIERITQDPKHVGSILSDRIKQMDRSTFVALLEQNKNINHDQAEKVATYVATAIDFVSSKVASTKNKTQELQHTSTENATATSDDQKAKAETGLKNYLNRMNRTEVSYDSLQGDLERILHDPKSSFSVIKNRISQFDRETLMALLTNNEKISREDVNKIVDKVEETKNGIMAKVEKMEAEAERRLEEVKHEVIHQAENARKTAASAAWWLFATAFLSAIAAAAGGWIAIIS